MGLVDESLKKNVEGVEGQGLLVPKPDRDTQPSTLKPNTLNPKRPKPVQTE